MVMEVSGLDKIRRVQGKVQLRRVPAVAAAKGTGLTGTYSPKPDFQDKAFTRVEPFFRFGQRNTNDQGHESAAWLKLLREAKVPDAQFSVIWQGAIEPPVSEDYQLSIYLTGTARLYIGGKLLLDTKKTGRPLYTGLQSHISGNATAAVSNPIRPRLIRRRGTQSRAE